MAHYPPAGFHFLVTFLLPQAGDLDVRFQEVSGLGVDLGAEELVEGGENRFAHQLPTGTRHGNLVLKRGLLTHSGVTLWVRAALEAFEFLPTSVLVTLLNEQHAPLAAWHFANAYPVKWNVGNLNATENGVLVETLELAYQLQTPTVI
jgi:phage tail-like protein